MAASVESGGEAEATPSPPDRSGLGDPRLEGCAERLAHGLQLDPVEHVLEEAATISRSASERGRPRAIR